ncbi:MAG: hypothetical protein IIT39_13845 [Clostridia bacterium]|nr:hypothetical protein [Clostridia bacterium]
MIRIVKKQRVPTIFGKIKSRRSDYDELVSSEKDELKQVLLEEQGYKCAYCMSNISMSNSTIEHYIPRNGTNGDMSLSLDYRNLFAVCDTTRGCPEEEQTCDVKKGDKLLHIDPRLQEHIDTIYYDRSGYIRSSFSAGAENFDDDLNQILNLNSRQLLNNRVSAWKTLMQRMNKKKDKTWTADFIHKYIDKLSGSDDRTAYSGFLVYLLKQRV